MKKLLLIFAGCASVPAPPTELGTLQHPVETVMYGWDTNGDGETDLRVYYAAHWDEGLTISAHPWKIEELWNGILERASYDYNMDGDIDEVRTYSVPAGMQ